jgi:MSHA pilin protein MshD
MRSLPRKQERGFTLVELVVAMVVVSVALGGVLMVMNYTVQHSADPMLQHQAVAIAESYLEEVLLKPFDDGPYGGATRSLLDDVDDYNGLSDSGAHDQNGTPINGMGNYTVAVAVANEDWEGMDSANCKRVTVTVSHPAIGNLSLIGYRTSY